MKGRSYMYYSLRILLTVILLIASYGKTHDSHSKESRNKIRPTIYVFGGVFQCGHMQYYVQYAPVSNPDTVYM